jgi:stearoyl-CoA desaturase (delta-9 desaturase)
METTRKVINFVALVVPFAALIVAIVLLWNRAVGWTDIAILLVMYAVTGLAITVGWHRCLTHRAFKTYRWMRLAIAIVGSMAVQSSVLNWVADHRKHHAYTDEEGDPHSPHTDHGPGIWGDLKGLFHAHMGWLFRSEGRADPARYARDLFQDRAMRVIHWMFVPLVLLGLAIPFLLGWGLTGEIVGGVTALIWGGLVRIFLLHHATFSINSICHFFGRRRFNTDDESRNVFWLALITFGESWHHNHHAFPRSAFHGLRRWEFVLDPGGWVVSLMEKVGLAWDVVRVDPERQQARAGAELPSNT